jgi:uncharacterized protein (DUF983 family)
MKGIAADRRAMGLGLQSAAGAGQGAGMTLTIVTPYPSLPVPRSWRQAMVRGFLHRCPSCGRGHMFRAYLKVADACDSCGTDLRHQRADDAPPYFTMLIVGHIVVPLALLVERLWHPDVLIHLLAWTIVTLGLTFTLLPSVKGAIVGLQWALRMHGFGDTDTHDGE